MSLVMNVGVALSVVAGTVACTLGVLAWRPFRGTPFGRLLAIIPVVYALFVGFHTVIVVAGAGHSGSPWTVAILETLAFGGLAVFTVYAVRLHGKMSRRSGGER